MRTADITRFTEGDCHVLAFRLHRVTGWTLATFGFGSQPVSHAFVICPDGDALDVEGKRPMAEFLRKWGEDKVLTWTLDTWPDKFWEREPCFGRYSYRRARVIAGKLLDSIGWKA